MSVENLKEYARRCVHDPELRARASAIGVENLEEHMKLAGALGLDWTEDDMIAFSKEVVGADGELEELTRDELEQAAGGVVTVTSAVVLGGVAAIALVVGVVAAAGSDW